MSETDDTEVLVTIPPNFFSVHSSGSEDSLLDSSRTVVHKPSCTAQVLGKLVNQVHLLENRLESLELTTDSVSSYGGRSRHKTWDFSASVDSVSVTKFSTFPRRRRHKTPSHRERRKDLSLTSLDSLSSYSKHIPPLLLNSKKSAESAADDICSMDGDLSSIVSTPSKKNDKLLLHEIDEFLTKVESYELPESKLQLSETTLSPENVIKATGDYISHKMDSRNSSDDIRLPSGRMVSSNVLDKYIYLVKSNAASTSSQTDKPFTSNRSFTNESTAKTSDQTSIKPNEAQKPNQNTKSPSVRRLSYLENKDIQPTSTPKRAEISNANTFRPSSNKIYERASKALEQYKQNYSYPQNGSYSTGYQSTLKKEEFKVPSNPPSRPYMYDKERQQQNILQSSRFIDTIDTELLSLTDLWGEKREEKVNCLKLEEERMKREHCEALIQELQKKLLEQQERLAVAIKVDRSKDNAIAKLRDAWMRLTNGLDVTEEQHKAEIEKMRREIEGGKVAADEARKKAEHFEAELYKALDLAHDYQDKCKQLETSNEQIKQKTEKQLSDKDGVICGKEKEIQVLRENYETVMRLNKQATDCVRNVEEALEKERHEHDQTKLKLSEFARQLQQTQEESDVTRRERDALRLRVNEERARWNMLEKQLADKQEQCVDLMRRCETLEAESSNVQSRLEEQRLSLKQHYQAQLEAAVGGKLREFQLQLEAAERGLAGESRAREDARRRDLEQQHKLEVKVLEEKHKEETKLYRLQLAQLSEKVGLLESKLSSHRQRRGRMAEQLHAVMQAQWRQALAILTNPPADQVSTPEPQDYSRIPSLSLPPLGGGAGAAGDAGLSFDALSDAELQQCVRLLLAKPPQLDISADTTNSVAEKEKQREINEEPTSDRADRDRRDKRRPVNKPPWKS